MSTSTGSMPRSRSLLAAAAFLVVLAGPGATAHAAGAPRASAPRASAPRANGRAADTRPVGNAPVVGMAADPRTGGYWLVAADGGVFAFDAPYLGSTGALTLNSPVVGMAATIDGGGYWLVAADGGVFSYGDAPFLGSTGSMRLARPVVGMAADPRTGGYWLVAADGGVFAFDAPYLGSTGALTLNSPVVGMAATIDGGGYWLVAADGGVFAYGDAPFLGSTGSKRLARPVVGMAADPRTGGYWLVAADGGVFAFDAPYLGSTGAVVLNRAVIGAAAVLGGAGYWLVGADGGLYAFGDAPYLGSVAVLPLAGLTVVLDPGHNGGNGGAPQTVNQPIDGGGFTEPCDTSGTTTNNGYSEHAFNFAVASATQALLQQAGAHVVLTRTSDDGVGPCVDVRAAIANNLRAAAAVSIHADGGPPNGRGFAVDTPVPVVSSISDNRSIVGPSGALGDDLRDAFAAATGEPVSTYAGVDGIMPRGDLGGLDLSTVPKVLIECANMRNATDGTLVQDPSWRQSAAAGIASGVQAYLEATLRT
jgi:N-acetylmuramoyl-L-alanine amidase